MFQIDILTCCPLDMTLPFVGSVICFSKLRLMTGTGGNSFNVSNICQPWYTIVVRYQQQNQNLHCCCYCCCCYCCCYCYCYCYCYCWCWCWCYKYRFSSPSSSKTVGLFSPPPLWQTQLLLHSRTECEDSRQEGRVQIPWIYLPSCSHQIIEWVIITSPSVSSTNVSWRSLLSILCLVFSLAAAYIRFVIFSCLCPSFLFLV